MIALAPVSPEAMLAEIVSHLDASLAQPLPSDDQIIMGHVRSAHDLAKTLASAQRNAA